MHGVYYSDIYTKNKKILIIGVNPPPLGGVSVHVYRLLKFLKKNNYTVELFDTSQKQKFKGSKYVKLCLKFTLNKYDVIHIHVNDVRIFKLMLILKRIRSNTEFFLTLHNPRLLKNTKEKNKSFVYFFLSKLDKLIVVSNEILEVLKKNNINLPEKVIIKNAYIEPPIEEEKSILSTYPKNFYNFLNNHSPILIANASKISIFKEIDLYGLDMCVELTSMLKTHFPSVGFLFGLADSVFNRDYIQQVKKKIEGLELNDSFYLFTGQKELWPLFKKANLLIRPTYSDGYPMSILEALDLGCKVIASDCCMRHKRTILFKNRDLNDLYEKCVSVLKK
jgi:glycosyltransferase involved in cell wall biosynthesis